MILSAIIGKETYLIYHYIMVATKKKKIRNGPRKLIEYNEGHQLIIPTNKLYWRLKKYKKSLQDKIHDMDK